jgi:hypothetical protein
VSEATIVVRQYETAAELSEGFGRALADVKSVQLGIEGGRQISPAALDASRQTLQTILTAVIQALQGNAVEVGPYVIPAALTAWINTLYRSESPTMQDLERMVSRLHRLPTRLDNFDLRQLDQLLEIFDAHTSHLFHRIPLSGRAS